MNKISVWSLTNCVSTEVFMGALVIFEKEAILSKSTLSNGLPRRLGFFPAITYCLSHPQMTVLNIYCRLAHVRFIEFASDLHMI